MSTSETRSQLSDEERAELERLRAEKAAREQAAAADRERAELEQLRSEFAATKERAAEDARIAERKAHGRELVEPDDDLRMPVAQKIVLIVLAVIVLIFVLSNFVKL